MWQRKIIDDKLSQEEAEVEDRNEELLKPVQAKHTLFLRGESKKSLERLYPQNLPQVYSPMTICKFRQLQTEICVV